MLHWDLSSKNADSKEIERVAVDAAAEMESGDTLIWDRLGRSGRALHPSAQHYSPEAKATFEEHGVTIKFLPPKGKCFNPLDLLFNDLKTHYIRPKFPEKWFTAAKVENRRACSRICRREGADYVMRFLSCSCEWS